MEAWVELHLAALLATLALPRFGLSTVFIVALVSATLLPLGSEPAVFGLVKLNPALFWPAIAVATLGNTLGGVITWWMGYGAERAYESVHELASHPSAGHPSAGHPSAAHPSADPHRAPHRAPRSAPQRRALAWLRRYGAKGCLLSWLPVVGDPLCAVAGWLKLPFWPCVLYMAVGKFVRYVTMTAALLWVFPAGLPAWAGG